MRGLLEKDFRILKQRNRTLLIFGVIAVLLSYSVGGEFIISYGMVLAITLGVSTISYDEFDNGYPFLMVLPVTRKEYVVEKYILSLFLMLVTWVFTLLLSFVSYFVKGEGVSLGESVLAAISIFFLLSVFLSVMIPMQLKFGAEKSRMILVMMIGICFGAAFVGSKLLERMAFDFERLTNQLNQVNEAVFVLATAIFAAISMAVSCACSIKIMEKKEF